MYMTEEGQEEVGMPTLEVKDMISKANFADVLPRQGACLFALKKIHNIIKMYVIQEDPAGSGSRRPINALREGILKEGNIHVVHDVSPSYEPPSNGYIEWG